MRALCLVFAAAAGLLAQEPAAPAAHAPTHAAKEGAKPVAESETNSNELWWKWANFVMLAAGLGYLINKNAGAFFRSRTAEIQSGISEARRMKEEADAKAAEIDRKLAGLQAEVESIRSTSKVEIQAEGERVGAETARQIGRIQAQAEQEIASAAKLASHELKAYSAQLALELAEKQIQSRVSPEVQDRLVNSFLRDLDGKAAKN